MGGKMTEEDIRNRKKYIEEIRSSFPECGIETGDRCRARGNGSADPLSPELQAAGIAGGIRLRLFASFLLFAAFFAMYKSGETFFGFSPDDIMEKIAENYNYTNLEKYVMMIFDSINL